MSLNENERDAIKSLLKWEGDYYAVKICCDVLEILSGNFCDDDVIEILERAKEDLELWVDNYDPTPYEAPVA